MPSQQPEGTMMHLTPKAAVTIIDLIGAPLTGGIVAGAGLLSAHTLSSWGLFPALTGDIVSSTTIAVITGVVASLPVVFGFWLKLRRQPVELRALEDRLNQAERQAITAERTALVEELRATIEALKKERDTLVATIDARNLSLHERDVTVAARDATIAGLNQQVALLTGLVSGKRTGGGDGG